MEQKEAAEAATATATAASIFGKMSIKPGIEGEGKPMVIKKTEIKGRVLPVNERKKPKRANGDSIF
jgi:hypothetical protein